MRPSPAERSLLRAQSASPARGRIARSAVAPIAALVVVVVVGIGGCGKGDAARGGGAKGPLLVRVLDAQIERVPRVIELSGTLAGAEEITVSTEVDGRVESIDADLGDVVTKGGPLVHIASAELALRVDQAAADALQATAKLGVDDAGLDALEVAQVAGVRRADADYAEATRTLARITELFSQGLAAQGELDAAATRARVAEAALQAARDEVTSSIATARSRKAALGLARKKLRDATPTSPAAGVVAERLVAPGEYVRAGQAIARVVVVDPLKLKGDIPERYAPDVRAGLPVEVSVDAAAARVVGTVSRVGPVVAEGSRTFRIEAVIANPAGKDGARALKPGTFARAQIVLGVDDDVVAVPETAVATVAGAAKL